MESATSPQGSWWPARAAAISGAQHSLGSAGGRWAVSGWRHGAEPVCGLHPDCLIDSCSGPLTKDRKWLILKGLSTTIWSGQETTALSDLAGGTIKWYNRSIWKIV